MIDPAVEALKKSNIVRSFYKFFSEQNFDVLVLYGDEADEFPENPNKVLPAKEAVVILVKATRMAGGRGDDPHNFIVQIWTRKAMDRYGTLAETWEDRVVLALNKVIPMYSFSDDRANPILIGENYNLYAKFEGSYPLTDEQDQISKWEMQYSVYSWRGAMRY